MKRFIGIVNEIPYWVMLLLIICLTMYAPIELTRIIIRDISEMPLPRSVYITEIIFTIFSYAIAIFVITIRLRRRK